MIDTIIEKEESTPHFVPFPPSFVLICLLAAVCHRRRPSNVGGLLNLTCGVRTYVRTVRLPSQRSTRLIGWMIDCLVDWSIG